MTIRLEDITKNQRIFADVYLRKVMINTKRKFYRTLTRPNRYGITVIHLEDEAGYDEPGFDKAACSYVEVLDAKIPVYDPGLYTALLRLSEHERVALLGSVILRIPMARLATILGVCKRTAEKYKHGAIKGFEWIHGTIARTADPCFRPISCLPF